MIIAVLTIVLMAAGQPEQHGKQVPHDHRKALDLEASDSPITLTVEAGEFRKVQGDLFIELSDADGQIIAAEIHPVTARTMTVRLDSLPPGPKAVRLFHDENSNGTLDTNFFGIPSEGYGFSNNPRSRFGEPSFADRLFEHQADTTIQVTLVHW